ncbi:diaminopimelate decarboxylase [Rothia aerolata]|uniref:Diaminopimelate decarboxylase n=1 Tax=Rothia aerolata TaxID=1812262 RepID=A0A917IQ50_9MICC|nr:diaminopimelate decarboxylase [Rothia aerolata]GGH59219.1 diaminopimelate decarboxylase [Rothia aerolata]
MGAEAALLKPDWLTYPENPAELNRTIWLDNFQRDESGELTVDGCPVTELTEKFGTPEYVFSESAFRARAGEFRDAFSQAFEEHGAEVSVYYAGKSFLSTAVAHWAHEEGLNLDTASGGELAVAMRAGVPGEKIALHGNNKSVAEIRRALDYGVGRIVADSIPEVQLIAQIATEMGKIAPVMLRVTPGVHASTHDFIATAHEDQKFGQSMAAGTARLAGVSAEELESLELREDDAYATVAVALALRAESIDLRGLHCHIGSQIFEAEGFSKAAEKVLGYMQELNRRFEVELPEIDLGGGYGIGYIEGEQPRAAADVATELADSVSKTCANLGMEIPHLSFEPGRSISGPSGITLYTVGTIKNVAIEDEHGETRVRRYVSVDGGMSDNARPVLYDADYTAVLANRAPAGEQVLSRVVGKHCESGDIVVRYTYLPEDLKAGDILAVPATGAYCYALSSNYNMLTRPPVVATKAQQEPRLMIRGETEEDLLARDQGLL